MLVYRDSARDANKASGRGESSPAYCKRVKPTNATTSSKKLDEFHGNVSRAAEGLGLERSHLYRKMKALGVSVKE